MSVKYENEIGMEYTLQKPEVEGDPDSFFFSSHEVGETVNEIPSGYEIYEDPEAIVDIVRTLPEEGERIIGEISGGNVTYTANMKFDRSEDGKKYYVDRRMFSGLQKRDEERWLFVAEEENITEAASKYLPHLEQDSFFELGI